MAIKKPARASNSPKSTSENVEEVEEVIEETPEEVQVVDDAADDDATTRMVKVAVNTMIEPAPTVGRVSMVRDYGVAKLTPGVHTLPACVADVLVDRKLAQYV